MDRPRLYVDFNEMLEPDLVLLAKTDTKIDSSGAVIELHEGKLVYVYTDDTDEHDRPDNLIADGVAVLNTAKGWGSAARWCCRIDQRGIRHESDERSATAAES